MNDNLIDTVLKYIKDSSDTTTYYYNNMSSYQKNIFDSLISDSSKFRDYSLNDLRDFSKIKVTI